MTCRLDAEAALRFKEPGIGRARQGVESINRSLERMQKVAATVALSGGGIEALRRSVGRAVRPRPRARGAARATMPPAAR